jgi:hypothetical protein
VENGIMNEIYIFDGFNLDQEEQGYLVESINWLNGVNTSDTVLNAGGIQGVFSSPTYIRERILVIEGIISVDTIEILQDRINTLKKIFSVEWNPVGEGTKELFIQDANGDQWKAQARVRELPEFDRDENTGRYRVELIMSDSRFRSNVATSVMGSEGYIGGVAFPVALPFELQGYTGTSLVTTNGNVASPLKITITATGDIDNAIIIANVTTGDLFSFTASAVAGDVFVIDSGHDTNQTSLTKNGQNILSSKTPGSVWPSVFGAMEFVAADSDQNSDFNITYDFYDRQV